MYITSLLEYFQGQKQVKIYQKFIFTKILVCFRIIRHCALDTTEIEEGSENNGYEGLKMIRESS